VSPAPKTTAPIVAVAISNELIGHVEYLRSQALGEIERDPLTAFRGINWPSRYALPAYICAVASIEAFVNEVFLGPMAKGGLVHFLPASAVNDDAFERLDLRSKIVLLPQLAFGKTLDRGRRPYQDMATLVQVRNDLIHYKMDMRTPSYLARLRQRRFALAADMTSGPGTWVDSMKCSEGIRWALNTACETANAIAALLPQRGTGRFARWRSAIFVSSRARP
jgi:hypothetical protein